MNDELAGIGKLLVDDKATEVRIRSLEREFQDADPWDCQTIYLVQIELEIAYKTYMMLHRNLKEIQLPQPSENMLTPINY